MSPRLDVHEGLGTRRVGDETVSKIMDKVGELVVDGIVQSTLIGAHLPTHVARFDALASVQRCALRRDIAPRVTIPLLQWLEPRIDGDALVAVQLLEEPGTELLNERQHLFLRHT
jgi:hypothetical protein